MSINRIPDELWGMIFDYVGQSTFDDHPEPLKRRLNFGPRVSLVCKSWHWVAETIPSIWQHIDLKLPRRSDGVDVMYPYMKSIDLLHKRCKGVSELGYPKTIHATVENSSVIEAITFATEPSSGNVLDHIEIRFCKTSNFTFVSPLTKSLDVDMLKNVEYDDYEDCDNWRYVDFVESQVTILENLRVHGCDVPSRALNHYMGLKHLDIGGQQDAYVIEDEDEMEDENTPPLPQPSFLRDRLKTLKLRQSYFRERMSFRSWLLPNVRHLSLTGTGTSLLSKLELPALETFEIGLSDEPFQRKTIWSDDVKECFTDLTRNLKGLSIRKLDDPETLGILETVDLSNLESISLFESSKCFTLFQRGILGSIYKALRRVTISQDQSIDYTELAPLLEKPTNLEEIRVSKKIAGSFDEHDRLKKFLIKETEHHYVFHPRAPNVDS